MKIKIINLIYIKMITHVKISYFLRVLFNYIEEKQKLKLIKYNKIKVYKIF